MEHTTKDSLKMIKLMVEEFFTISLITQLMMGCGSKVNFMVMEYFIINSQQSCSKHSIFGISTKSNKIGSNMKVKMIIFR